MPSLDGVTWLKGGAPSADKPFVLIEFWGTECGPCRRSYPHMTKLASTFADTLDVVGLTSEGRDAAQPFIDKQGDKMTYNLGVADDDTYMALMTGIPGIPWTFLFDSDRTLVYAGCPARACKIVGQLARNELTSADVKDLPADTDADYAYDPADEFTPERSAAQDVALAAIEAKGATVTWKQDYWCVGFDVEAGFGLTFGFEDGVNISAWLGGFDDDRVARAKEVAAKHRQLELDSFDEGKKPGDTDRWIHVNVHYAFDAFNQAHAEHAIEAITKVLEA